VVLLRAEADLLPRRGAGEPVVAPCLDELSGEPGMRRLSDRDDVVAVLSKQHRLPFRRRCAEARPTSQSAAPHLILNRDVARPAGAASYRGRSVQPMRNSSTARAHCRPSRIAQTTSDCPRRMSPAANTLGTVVA